MANRIYYANQQAGFKGQSAAGTTSSPNYTFTAAHVIKGLQSVGYSSTFNSRQVFEICQNSIYENIEDLPEVNVTMSKILDGCTLLYHHATQDADSPTLAGRSSARCVFALSIFDDTVDAATGEPESTMVCPDLYINSASYSFPAESDFTEEISLLGTERLWKYSDSLPEQDQPAENCSGESICCDDFVTRVAAISFPGFCDNNDVPCYCSGEGVGVQNAKDIIFTPSDDLTSDPAGTDVNGMDDDPDVTILPPDIPGIDNFGRRNGACIQNISVSVDFNRDEFKCLGSRQVAFRAIRFPVEVTTEIEVIGKVGDMISHTATGVYNCGTCNDISNSCPSVGSNTLNRTIRVAICDSLRIYTGTKNKLRNVSVSGGDAGGDNVRITYSYSTFNDFTVIHNSDVNSNAATWWTNRATYLVD